MPLIRRMSAGPVSGPDALPAPETVQPNETSVTSIPVSGLEGAFTFQGPERPLPWRFTRPPDPEKDPTHPGFRRVSLTSPIVKDEGQLDRLLDAAWAMKERLADDDSIPHAIRAGEIDIWKKITVQRGWRMDRILVSLNPPPIEPPAAWFAMGRRVLKAYADSYVEADIPEPPFETNAGYPLFTTGFAAKLASALLFVGHTTKEVHEANLAFCTRVGLPEVVANSFGLNFRQGPRYKAEPYWNHVGAGRWDATVSYTGAWPRARGVYMGAFGSALKLSPGLKQLQGGRRGIVGQWHVGPSDSILVAMAYAAGWLLKEADISAYDLTVSRRLQEGLHELLCERFPRLKDVWDLWLYMECRPVIGPSMDLAGPYTLWTTYGGTHSGLRLTSEIGTLITTITTLWALQELVKYDVVDAWLNKKILLLVHGDDILIGSSKLPSSEDWAAKWAEIGFTCNLDDGVRFLMKHRVGSETYPVAGRIVQQTLSNEHEPTGAYAEIIALLGLAARWGKGPYPGLVPYIDGVLQHTDMYQRWGLKSGAEAAARLKEPDAATALQRALAALANDPWFTQLQRDAPHRPSAQAELLLLRQMGIDIADPDQRLNTILYRAVSRVRSTEKAIDMAVELWHQSQVGKPTVGTCLEIVNGG